MWEAAPWDKAELRNPVCNSGKARVGGGHTNILPNIPVLGKVKCCSPKLHVNIDHLHTLWDLGLPTLESRFVKPRAPSHSSLSAGLWEEHWCQPAQKCWAGTCRGWPWLFLHVLFLIWWLTASCSLHPKSSQIAVFCYSTFSHLFVFIYFKPLNHQIPLSFKKNQCCSYSPSCQPCPCLHCRSCKLQPLPSFLCETGEFSSLRLPFQRLWCKNQLSHHSLSWSHTKSIISDYMERSSKKSDESLTNGC